LIGRFEGESDKILGFSELLSDRGLVLRVPALDKDGKAFGDKLHFVAEPFDQHAGMTLHLLDSLVKSTFKPLFQVLKAPIYLLKPLIYPLKPLIYPLKPLVYPLKPLVYPLKPLFQVLKSPV